MVLGPRTIHESDEPFRHGGSLRAALPLAVLAGLIVLSPWFFGGVHARVQFWMLAGISVALALGLATMLAGRSSGLVIPTASVVFMGGLSLGAVQLIPLPPGVADRLPPSVLRLGSPFIGAEGAAEGPFSRDFLLSSRDEHLPLSWYPAATRRELALLVLASGGFLCGAVFFRTAQAGMGLCGVAAATGAAVAFFGLVQKLTWNGLLYWQIPLSLGGKPFGPYVSRNAAGGFLCLCLAGAVGLLLWALGRGESRESADAGDWLGRPRTWPARISRGLLRQVAGLDALTIAAVSLTACIAAGILCSLSRGAILAMIGAGLAAGAAMVVSRRRSVAIWAVAAVAAASLALVSWVGMSDSVRDRMATLLRQDLLSQSRIPHWRDGLEAAADFWQVGSGLGTYRYVYRPYQQRFSPVWYHHAENEYLEALVEGGAAGLGLILVFLALIALACRSLLRAPGDVRTYALGVAGVFALASQATHAFFDFGLHVPANMLLFAVFCGAVSGRAAELAERRLAPAFLGLPRVRALPAMLTAALLAASLWGCCEIRACAAVETALRRTQFDAQTAGTTVETLSEANEQMEHAVGQRSDDAEARRRLATLWTHLYRVRSLARAIDGQEPEADEARLWEYTSPVMIHARAHYLAGHGGAARLEAFRGEPLLRDHLGGALEQLALARRCCPLFPEVHVRMAELSVLGGELAGDEIHLARARMLSPGDPHVLFHAGLLELQAGRLEMACESWRRSLTLSLEYLEPILGLAGRQVSLWHMVHKVLPASPRLLVKLARQRYATAGDAAIRGMLVERAGGLVETADLPDAERHYLRGAVLSMKGLDGRAIEELSRAVELEPAAVEWRYELALLLKQNARITEARAHARLCARMDPRNRAYDELLREINQLQLTLFTDPS